MTVEEWFLKEKIDLAFLELMAGESEYWEKCANFITEKWATPTEELSVKQLDWAERILEDCVEKRIEG